MFIDPSTGGDAQSVGVPGPQKRKRPVTFYLRGIVRTPSYSFSDIAIDQPIWRGTAMLLAGLAVAGALFGLGGLIPDYEGLQGATIGVVGFTLGGYTAFLSLVVLLHLIGKTFEGEASIAEELSAMTFAALSFWLLVPTALAWLVAGIAGPWILTLGIILTSLAVIRLTYIAIREANRFVGTQAILTMLMLPLGMGLLAIATFFVFAFGTLILE
ncbi:MAG: hypothetical protein F4X20_00250 [Dehalococcoidia bacterium]|nr:hypothetical protein [Dehalococcoidia bacterium]